MSLSLSFFTKVPIQLKMIQPDLLTIEEINWLNDYHVMCQDTIGPVLLEQGRPEAYKWLMKETQLLG